MACERLNSFQNTSRFQLFNLIQPYVTCIKILINQSNPFSSPFSFTKDWFVLRYKNKYSIIIIIAITNTQ